MAGALPCSWLLTVAAWAIKSVALSTDIVMLFMNDRALKSLLSDKFKLGADASVAAGPVGRNASAGTDLKLTAEILFTRVPKAFSLA